MKSPDFSFSSSSSFWNLPLSWDSQLKSPMKSKLSCHMCTRSYSSKFTLWRHLKYECGKEPKFSCMFCPKKAYYRTEISRHMKKKHGVDFSPGINATPFKNEFPVVQLLP